VLEHQHAIADAQTQCAAAAAFADHGDDQRYLQRRHLAQVHRNRLGLPALFRANAGIRALRVDEAEDRELEFLGELHHPQSFAKSLGPRLPEVADHFLLRVAPLLVPNDADRGPLEAAEAGDDRRVIPELPVAVDLDPLLDHRGDEVERVRPLGMPRDERLLPRREVRIDFVGDFGKLLPEVGDLGFTGRVRFPRRFP
jgi:hypothetical protein